MYSVESMQSFCLILIYNFIYSKKLKVWIKSKLMCLVYSIWYFVQYQGLIKEIWLNSQVHCWKDYTSACT